MHQLLNITFTTHFENYLEFFILNHSPKPSDFQYIIDNMGKSFLVENIIFLIQHGVLLLLIPPPIPLRRTLCSIYSFLSKLTKVLTKFKEIFLGGSSVHKHKIHYLNRDTITSLKEKRGLCNALHLLSKDSNHPPMCIGPKSRIS